MKKVLLLPIVVLLAVVSLVASADELSGYVQNCESELGFAASEVPTLDCNDGELFKRNDFGPENDFTGHARINPNVDLVFACRWLSARGDYAHTAVTIELLIHNRDNGATCFFEAKDTGTGGDPEVSTTIISPTDPRASSYWMQPKDLNAKQFSSGIAGQFPNGFLRCVGCHVAGPYIASTSIAPALAKFGLLNDGHDTSATRYYAVMPPLTRLGSTQIFRSSFWLWNNIIQDNNSTSGLASCATGCHSIGTGSNTDPLLPAINASPVVPSLQMDIQDVSGSGLMPADKPTNTMVDNSYRWVNMDVPDSGDYQEHETLSDLKVAYPRFYCKNPSSLSVHRVDSGIVISTNDFPDKFDRFNLQDGLVCLNKDQPSGHCQNYQTRYYCDGRWTAWQDNDDPGSSGDWELRRDFKGICASPDWIQARYKADSKYIIAHGPIDRLAEFDNKGLVCRNADQDNGRCSNYVVRFECL